MENQIKKAENLGFAGYKNNKNAPCQCKETTEMFEGRKVGQTPQGEASTIEILNAWNRGWNKAKREEMKELFPEMYA